MSKAKKRGIISALILGAAAIIGAVIYKRKRG